jgi:molybdopterin converting factor subunit 1
MTVRVKLFARARDLAGVSEVVVTLPDGATVAELRRVLANEHPALAGLLTRSAIAVADDFAPETMHIPDGAQVALLPPVSGG